MTRTFDTGATRDKDDNKLDYEGFLSPLVIESFARYMHTKRQMPDGSRRDSDNWQRGIPINEYMKSEWRHFMQQWQLHRGIQPVDDKGEPVEMEEALCAVLFNVMGYLHEYLKAKRSAPPMFVAPPTPVKLPDIWDILELPPVGDPPPREGYLRLDLQ